MRGRGSRLADVLVAHRLWITRDVARRGAHPDYLRREVEDSLHPLGTDRIDLYQLHRPDPNVPYDESVGALLELKDEGKIRHSGVSDVTVEQLEQAERIKPIVSVQNR